jgi:hypothetical protein
MILSGAERVGGNRSGERQRGEGRLSGEVNLKGDRVSAWTAARLGPRHERSIPIRTHVGSGYTEKLPC